MSFGNLKRAGVALALLLVSVFVVCMFLPVSSLVADINAKFAGYNAPDSYEDIEYRYYYNALTDNEKHAYRIIYAALPEFPDEIIVPKMSDDELENIFEALSYDNPELFFMGKRCSLTSIGNVYYFVPEYIMDKDTYESYMSKVSEKSELIIAAVSSMSDDYEKELYIHDYLAENCTYQNKVGDDMLFTLYGLLVNGEANCEGYSRTAQYLFNECGIINHLVAGVAPDSDGSYQGHMWNAVEINGEWFNLDVTWDDYLLNNSVEYPDNTASHIYFNISTADMAGSHSADADELWEECTGESFGYFKNNGVMFDSYGSDVEEAIEKRLVDVLNEGKMSVEFAFSNEAAYNEALSSLTNSHNGRMYSILSRVNREITSTQVNSSRIQYTTDEDMLVMRFFFTK